MIKEKWPYILIVFLLIGVGFIYSQCQTPKSNLSLNNSVNDKEPPAPQKDSVANSSNTKNTTDTTKLEEPKQSDIVIDVKGAVKKPGVYHMTQGDRIVDVLTKAGGLTDKADKKQVNMAKKLADEMMLYIPAIGEKLPDNTDSIANPSESDASGKININSANEQELEQIPGIGPSKAAAIIKYREENGPYQKVEDLDKVAGFGAKTIDRMKDQITVQ